MQLHSLEVEGFGPFRARQVVDFDTFADDGIFLIAGRTGAGKSSILDAVCFGLYGGVPRYEGGDKRIRSDHCEPDDPTEVVVEFSTSAGRYRVTRSPDYERPKKRGGGMTTQQAAVRLDTLVGGEWLTLAAKEREAGHELDEILQLSREQFLQVILLAQNRFSEFLLAGSKERQGLLRRLFGTQRFGDVQARFDDRRRAAEAALGSRLATVTARVEEGERLVTAAELWGEDHSHDVDGATTADDRLDGLRRALARAQYQVERRAVEQADAERVFSAAGAALTELREQQRAQTERDRARAALELLAAAEPQLAEARIELEHARAAEVVRSTIAAEARAQAAMADAIDGEARARSAWESHAIDVDDLQDWLIQRTRESGSWERARDLERSAATRQAELHAGESAVVEAAARIEASETERRELPAQREALVAQRDESRRIADRQSDLSSAREAAARRLAAAHDAVRLASEHDDAERRLLAASGELGSAQSALTRLRQRRLDGFAGELASTLHDAAACPVCGSHEHPMPATRSDPISADDVAAAERVRDLAADAEREAAEAASMLRAELAVAHTRADGRDITAAAAELADVTAEHEGSAAAADRLVQLDAQLHDVTDRIDLLERARADDAMALSSAREQLALLVQRGAEADAIIAEARGTFSSVAERLASTLVELDDARALIQASAERARCQASVTAAVEQLESALEASAFDDALAAHAALRPAAVQDELDARVTRHTVQKEKERAILFDLELRTLPEEPIELTAAEAAAESARASWTQAVDESAGALGVATQLGGLIDSAAVEHSLTAEIAAEFEVLRGIADTIAGRGANTRKMTLETFVLAAELEEIVDAANRRLRDMSEGRYQLRHSDALAARGAASGLGIIVFDAFTGQTRPAQSLSGGETFLSSLALALGLAEVVTSRAGGIHLDTLFIDEGFGSLDADTLDVAMRTLDELRQGGRTVGVISHVEAMQEQIPAQLSVRATAYGPSIIEVR